MLYARATAVSHVQSGEEWFQAWRDHTNRKKTLGAWGEPGHTRDERDTRAHTGTRTGTVPPPVFLIHECVPGSSPRAGPHGATPATAGCGSTKSSSCSSFVQFSDTFSLNSFVALLRPSISGRLSVSRLSPAYSRTRHIACPWCPVGDEGARTDGRAAARRTHTHTHNGQRVTQAHGQALHTMRACVRHTPPIAIQLHPLWSKNVLEAAESHRRRGRALTMALCSLLDGTQRRPRPSPHDARLTPQWRVQRRIAAALATRRPYLQIRT